MTKGKLSMFGNSFSGRLGEPGEREYGPHNAETQAGLPLIQSGLRMIVDFVSFLGALWFGFLVGRWAIWIIASSLVVMFGEPVGDWLADKSNNRAFSKAVLFLTNEWILWLYALPLWWLTFNVIQYQWVYELSANRSYIFFGGRLIPFPLLIRVVFGAVPVVYWMTAGKLRTRLEFEIAQAVPARAADYAEKGFNTRAWGPQPEPEPIEPQRMIRVEKVQPRGIFGNKIQGYDDLRNPDEIREAMNALSIGKIKTLSRRNLRALGISDGIARDILDQLKEGGYIEYLTENSAPQLTEYGRGLMGSISSGDQ